MEKVRVAIIGAGPSGLAMLKQLRADGFVTTLFERRSRVGGLWAFSEDENHTTALPRTRANISKFTCGFSDYPIPDKYPVYMNPHHFQEFMHDYAMHFDLLKDIRFNTSIKNVTRNEADTHWVLEMESEGKSSLVEFDKIAFCHGYQTKAALPTFDGQEKFSGVIMHSQQYRKPEDFVGKKVVVVGLGSTVGDIIPDLAPYASEIWLSHRRGAVPFKRFRNGTPQDLGITWRRRQIGFIIQRRFPWLAKLLADTLVAYLGRRTFGKLDPAWRLEPFPSITLNLPGSWEDVVPLMKDGTVRNMPGITKFTGSKSIEFADGTVLEDIDAVICATGYEADLSVAPFLEKSTPVAHGYSGEPIYRLYMNMFPPRYTDSCVLICYSAFGKSNGFSFGDLTAMAVSNVWRGVEKLPTRAEIDHHIDAHQAWVASRWKMEPNIDTSMVKAWEFQGWLHRAAGTGLENIGWGWRGWRFWLEDRKMYNLMNNGVETAHMYRYFETGKRKTWDGARDAILHANETVKMFPIKEDTEVSK